MLKRFMKTLMLIIINKIKRLNFACLDTCEIFGQETAGW